MRREDLERMSWHARQRYYSRLAALRRKLPDLEPHICLEEARRLQHEIPFDPPEVIAARQHLLATLTTPKKKKGTR